MAQRAQPVITVLGIGALGLTVALILAPPITLLIVADGGGLTSADWSAIRFTLMQATLSAVISVLLAIPVARAMARRSFPGRGLLVTLLGAPFLLPVIVAVIGLLIVWGRSGWVSDLIGTPLSIYGLGGILLAHVFFNLPLATRLILQGWGQIPTEHFRLVAQLGFRPRTVFWHLEWPMLRSVLPGAFLLIFLLCITSFAVALTLGGGPRATTIELAIFEAVRFSFDLSRAAILSLIQFALCGAVAFLSLKISLSTGFATSSLTRTRRWDADSAVQRGLDIVAILLVALFMLAPMLALTVRGLAGFTDIPPIGRAVTTSLLVALGSTAFTTLTALALAQWIDRLRAGGTRLAALSEGISLITLAASPFVLGTGLFLLIRSIANPFAFALPATALVNATVALPIALRVLLPALEQSRLTHGRLGESLSITGWSRFRLITWPAIRAPLGFAAGIAAALSMGDLGVITLFAPPDVETLPLLMYRLMGSYQTQAAASVALILITLTLALFWLFDRGGRLGRHP